jgi:hypothetical protein
MRYLMSNDESIKMLTVRLPAKVHKKFRYIALVEDKKMTSILIKWIENRYRRLEKQGRVPKSD